MPLKFLLLLAILSTTITTTLSTSTHAQKSLPPSPFKTHCHYPAFFLPANLTNVNNCLIYLRTKGLNRTPCVVHPESMYTPMCESGDALVLGASRLGRGNAQVYSCTGVARAVERIIEGCTERDVVQGSYLSCQCGRWEWGIDTDNIHRSSGE